MNFSLICIIVALVVFALAVFNVPARPNLIALGLFFITLAALLGRVVLLLGTVLLFASCATREPSTAGLSKEQVQLEHARLVDASEVRKERWARVGEVAGTMAINIAGSWLKTWLEPKEDGLRK